MSYIEQCNAYENKYKNSADASIALGMLRTAEYPGFTTEDAVNAVQDFYSRHAYGTGMDEMYHEVMDIVALRFQEE